MTTKNLTIKQAARHLGKSEMWVRRMVHQAKLPHSRELVPGTEQVYRILIPIEALDARKTVTRTRRDDGRNKFTVYATPAEMKAFNEALKAAGIKVPVARANPPKSKKGHASKPSTEKA
jgi:hypothetical protein